MKVTEIHIGRKFNLGNYEMMDVHVTASVNEDEDPVKALYALEKLIMDYWSGRTSSLVARQVGETRK